MKNLYEAVQTRLFDLSNEPKGNALKRINSLSGFICGMIRKGSSYLPDLGSGLKQDINADSKTRAAERFVKNKWVDDQTHYLPFFEAFIRGLLFSGQLCRNKDLQIVIDGSQTGKDNATLMLSVVWRNRGLPICWLVKSGSKGHFKAADHEKLLTQGIRILSSILPESTTIVVLGDGEFDGIGLQQICLEATKRTSCTWNYVFRTASNTYLYENGEEFQAKNITPNEALKQKTFFIPKVEFTKQRFKYVNFLCWHDKKKHEKPIYLIANLTEERDIIDAYNLRYSIECLFKDLKSTSFNLHQTRLKEAQDVHRLIIIAALAFIFLTVLAINFDTLKYRKKVARYRNDRKVLSFFTFAYKLVDYLIDYQIRFNFSFQFSKNYS